MNEKTFNKEQLVLESPIPVSLESTKKITFQMQNCICKIFPKDGNIGTGFFCKIPFNNDFLPVLVTNHHIIKDIDNNNIIELSINGKTKIEIIIDESRKKYTNPDSYVDITIIEIKPEDGINDYLEIDDETNNKIFDSEYRNKSIYIMHYPKGDLSVSYGIIKDMMENKQITHLCSTEEGSSGCPILSLKTFKIIGIHYGYNAKNKFNYGTFIKYVIIKFSENILNYNEDNNLNNYEDNKINNYEDN